jgi:hypothetical protein
VQKDDKKDPFEVPGDFKSSKKGTTLHETDLFKIAVRNLSESDINQNFAYIVASQEDSTLRSIKVSILLIFYKVWCGYTKFLDSQVLGKGKLV